MSTSLFPAPVSRRKFPVEFKAGKMIREGTSKWLKPDERKGQGEEQLMHFYWKDRKTNTVEDDLIVFREEAEFVRVSECTTGRVYLLNFKSSSQKLFFWMQDAKDDKDEEHAAKINRLINDPQGGLAESRQSGGALGGTFRSMDDIAGFSNMDQEQLLQFLQGHGAFGGLPIPSTTPAEPQSATAPTSEAGSAAPQTSEQLGVTPEQLGNLRNILSKIQVPEGGRQPDLSLVDVLTPSAISPLLSNPEIASALFPHIPQNLERTEDELREVIQSPQFTQALQTLSVALQSGQLGPLLTSLGLDASAGIGVEAFLRAIQEQANRQQNNANNNQDTTEEHGGDRMDED
ncbi:6258_t:CDS:2 [Ambispora gerdemannii]|uniref:6258_t:CDS:1 n=1 Tax=Ambispora gerdemannii TaxID=144530 RepID=A0A9N8VFR5_9GLOM|nr:6258_t:CDS:2 [Ambispora gerdemannii]